MMIDLEDRMAGVLLGTAVGDAIGLPREGLSRRRSHRMLGSGPLHHALLFGRGMVSDDTEQTCFVAQALLRHGEDPERFARHLAWSLRWWLLRLPAGVGFGTLRAVLKLWLGFSPATSGVGSAGNGPAMRSAIIGACLRHAPAKLAAFCNASSRLTHGDPRAAEGATAIALAAALAVASDAGSLVPAQVLQQLRHHLSGRELLEHLTLAEQLLQQRAAPAELCRQMGLERGVTGFSNHTVPVALYCWLRSPDDVRRAVESVVLLGGDTDTTGAIVGALAGATTGAGGIPQEWLAGVVDWPLSTAWIRRLATGLAVRFPDAPGPGRPPEQPISLCWPGLVVRNLLFLTVVLLHGLRRLLPPY